MASTVLLLYGGLSAEREVSCVSARFIFQTLLNEDFRVLPVYIDQNNVWHKQTKVHVKAEEQENNPCFLDLQKKKALVTSAAYRKNRNQPSQDFDIVFPMIHGPTGEDGRLQGFFDFLGIPCVGADVLTSAICMDKYYSKTLLQQAGFPVVPFMRLGIGDWKNWPSQIKKDVLNEFDFPFFIKPCNMGSSLGISKVRSIDEFEKGIQYAFRYDEQILIEKAVEARELEISIMGNCPDYKVTDVGEIIVHSEFYSYEAKYLQETSELKIPAEITNERRNAIRDMATAAFRLVNGDGFARVDFFLTIGKDIKNQKIYLNEINTLPGFTPISMFPKLWEHAGIQPDVLLPNLIRLGFERHARKAE